MFDVIGIIATIVAPGAIYYIFHLKRKMRRQREEFDKDLAAAEKHRQTLDDEMALARRRNHEEHVRCKGCRGLYAISGCISEGENVWTCEDCRPKFCTYCGAEECSNCGGCTRPCKKVEGVEGCDCDDS